MLVSDFHFDLPEDRIAQEPLTDRAAARMLQVDQQKGAWTDRKFRDLPAILRPDDLLVMNNTRVFPARLYGRRRGAHAQPISKANPAAREFLQGRVEVLLTRQLSENPNDWECLVRPGRKVGMGEELFFGGDREHPRLRAEVVGRGGFGERTLRFFAVGDFFEILDEVGHVPLPPYISREDRPGDRERYQTVFARERGSVAAPTAGLHFTPEIFEQLRARGIETAEITLHVGLGTFQPVRTERVEEHRLHKEIYSVSERASEQINRAMEEGRRVVAVGTTSVRTLEFVASQSASGRVTAGAGEADLFIHPGFRFQVVRAMLTNFHLPQSTLLMLVAAFAGRELVLNAYRHAVESGYRFFSYGDCMFLE